jgi:hypothetical protein
MVLYIYITSTCSNTKRTWKVPAAQAAQAADPCSGAAEPASHGRQASADAWPAAWLAVPAGQAMQAAGSTAAPVGPYDPGGQSVQAVQPAEDAYLPVAQSTQVAPPNKAW